jgi:hypothetical protein
MFECHVFKTIFVWCHICLLGKTIPLSDGWNSLRLLSQNTLQCCQFPEIRDKPNYTGRAVTKEFEYKYKINYKHGAKKIVCVIYQPDIEEDFRIMYVT